MPRGGAGGAGLRGVRAHFERGVYGVGVWVTGGNGVGLKSLRYAGGRG